MLLAPRRDTPEGDQSLSSGLREEAQESRDEMGGVVVLPLGTPAKSFAFIELNTDKISIDFVK